MPPSIKGKNPVSKAIPQLINKIYALYISAAARGNDLAGSIRNRPFSVPVPVPGPPASLPRTAPFRLGNARCVPAPAYLSPPSPDILLSVILYPYAKNGSLLVRKERFSARTQRAVSARAQGRFSAHAKRAPVSRTPFPSAFQIQLTLAAMIVIASRNQQLPVQMARGTPPQPLTTGRCTSATDRSAC